MEKKLEDLEVDDLVIETSGVGVLTESIRIIERVTKTQIVIKGSISKFNRKTGDVVGDRQYWSPTIRAPKDGDIERVRKNVFRRKAARLLANYEWGELDIDTAKKVLNVLGLTP